MGNKTPKLHAVAVREIRLVRPSKINVKKASAALSSLSRALPGADELQKQADLLHVEAVLVSEGINDNDDAFTRAELKRAISSPLLKPMNWQHNDEKLLGAMYAVEARDLEGNRLDVDDIDESSDDPIELVIQGVVWHHLPHIQTTAKQIVQRIEGDDLFVSMECWFDNYEYGFYDAKGELYDIVPRNSDTAFLEGHLRANGGTGRFNNMRIGRALSGINFGGIAFVDRPANKRSYILNHFVFDPTQELVEVGASSDGLDQDQVFTQTTLFSDDQPTEVNMNDLNRAVATDVDAKIAKGVEQGVEKALDARDRAEAQKRTEESLNEAKARVAELEDELAKTASALERLQAAIDSAYAGATSDTPPEIQKIDQALEVKGDGAGDAVHAAKMSWIADSRKTIAEALVNNKDVEADTKLIEENTALKAELATIKNDIRKAEITHLFEKVLEMESSEVEKFVEAGLSKDSDEAYAEWLEEKMVFARKMMELKKNKKGPGYKSDENKKAAEDTEAGLLEPSQRETPIDDEGATLRSDHGRAPADMPRVPRSKLTAAQDLETLFEEVDEPNLAGASADEGNAGSPMGKLVAGLLGQQSEDKDN